MFQKRRPTAPGVGAMLMIVPLLAALASPVAAESFRVIGDTLTVVMRPILPVPEIVLPEGDFIIEAMAPQSTTGWAARLVRGEATHSLSVDSATYMTSFERWFLSVTVPCDVPAETYGLEVTASGGIYDEVDHAVTVRQSIESDFYFIHITDTHLPTHKYYYESGADTDTTEMEDLHAVIDDINIINPAFVLLTGDVINEGELEEYLDKRYFTRTQRILQRLRCSCLHDGGQSRHRRLGRHAAAGRNGSPQLVEVLRMALSERPASGRGRPHPELLVRLRRRALHRDRGLQQLRPLASHHLRERQLHRRPAGVARRRHRDRLTRHCRSSRSTTRTSRTSSTWGAWASTARCGATSTTRTAMSTRTRSTWRQRRSATASAPCVS